MSKIGDFKKSLENSKSELPLVLHNIDIKLREKIVSGKVLKMKKYRTNTFSVQGYYKHVSRFI